MSATAQDLWDDFRSIDPSKSVKLLRKDGDEEPMTVVELLRRTAKAHGNRFALVSKDPGTKQWIGISYNEYQAQVEKVSKAFIKLGLERHGAVAILASNCLEWFISDLAAISAG